MVFCFLFFQQEKEGPAGVWGRGLSRPQRRDLRGPIELKTVKLKASRITALPGQGKNLLAR